MTSSDRELVHDVVAGLLRRNGQVLLGHRHPERQWYPDVWDLPGGHVLPHEDPADALRRELSEELGIRITTRGEPPTFHLNDDDVRLSIWVIDDWVGTPSNLAPDEHDRIAWFSVEDSRTLSLAHLRYVEFIEQALTRT